MNAIGQVHRGRDTTHFMATRDLGARSRVWSLRHEPAFATGRQCPECSPIEYCVPSECNQWFKLASVAGTCRIGPRDG